LSSNPHEFHGDVAIDPQLRLAEAGSLRRWAFNWLLNSEIEGNYYQFIECWIALLIIANLFALVFEHVPAVYQPYAQWFHVFDLVSVGIFTLEAPCRRFGPIRDDQPRSPLVVASGLSHQPVSRCPRLIECA